MNDEDKIKAWDAMMINDPDATIMPEELIDLRKQVKKLTEERDEYKACKQQWYEYNTTNTIRSTKRTKIF